MPGPTVADLIVEAYTEIRVARAGDVLPAQLMTRGLLLYNSFLDAENADRRSVWADSASDFVLTPTLSPHTIGPNAATFAVTQRPVMIPMAQVNLGGGPPPVFRPIAIRSARWYANLPVPALATTFPTDLYYEPDWASPTNRNGQIFFWPVPTVAYTVRLWLRVILANVTNAAGTTFYMPPGYAEYHRLALAEALAPGAGQSLSQTSRDALARARARVFANNDETPALRTADSGLGGSRKTAFNWLTRQTE